MHGQFVAKDNRRPDFTLKEAVENPRRDLSRIVLPPAAYVQETEKLEQRWPAAIDFVKTQRLNEWFGPPYGEIGLIVLGGLYNNLMRALHLLGLADVYGETVLPIYVMNVAYPVIEEEVVSFCLGKTAVLMIEEGQPEYIEQSLHTLLRRRDIKTKVSGKDLLPRGGEYSAPVLVGGLEAFVAAHQPGLLGNRPPAPNADEVLADPKVKRLAGVVPPRPAGFCIGCPERPIFAAMKLVEQELGPHHVSADIGCHLFSILPPFNLGATTMGYGLGPASASAFNVPAAKRPISIMGDGGFWHNGLATSVGNAVFNKQDGVIMVVDNYYSAATGGQDLLSSRASNPRRLTNNSITRAVKGVGAGWVRQIRQYLQGRPDSRYLARGSDIHREGPEDHRRLVRVHAEQAASHPTADQPGNQGGKARRPREVRRR